MHLPEQSRANYCSERVVTVIFLREFANCFGEVHTSLYPSLTQQVCHIHVVCINHILYLRTETF